MYATEDNCGMQLEQNRLNTHDIMSNQKRKRFGRPTTDKLFKLNPFGTRTSQT